MTYFQGGVMDVKSQGTALFHFFGLDKSYSFCFYANKYWMKTKTR